MVLLLILSGGVAWRTPSLFKSVPKASRLAPKVFFLHLNIRTYIDRWSLQSLKIVDTVSTNHLPLLSAVQLDTAAPNH